MGTLLSHWCRFSIAIMEFHVRSYLYCSLFLSNLLFFSQSLSLFLCHVLHHHLLPLPVPLRLLLQLTQNLSLVVLQEMTDNYRV